MSRTLLTIFFFFIGAGSLYAQYLQGIVKNAKGVPVPYVRILIENLDQGSLTDEKGRYTLELPAGTYQLTFRHLSYEPKEIVVEINQDVRIDVELEEKDLQLATVEIEAGKRDPAYAIMKEVIANKKEHIKQFDAYQCDIYQKISLESDTIPNRKEKKALIDSLGADYLPKPGENRKLINLIESQATVHFQRPEKFKTIVKAYRDFQVPMDHELMVSIGTEGVSVDGATYSTQAYNPYLFYQDISEVNFNFYKNLIQAPGLGDRPFISPLHQTLWRVTYKYKLEDRFYENGKVNYLISIQPINKDGPYFKGSFVVEDKSFALRDIQLEIVPATLSFFKRFSVKQTFNRQKDGRSLLAEEDFSYDIKDGRALLYGSSYVKYTDYKLDPVFPKNFFKNELKRTEKDAFEKDSSDWETIRPFALNDSERAYIKRKDSIISYRTSPEYLAEIDSIYNHLKFLDFIVHGISWRQRSKGMRYFIDPLIAQVNPFGVGGYRHRFGGSVLKTFKRKTVLSVGGNLNYGVVNRDLRGGLQVGFTYLPRKFAHAYIKFGNQYSMVNPAETILATLSRGNFINKRYIGFGHRIEVVNGVYINASVDFADRRAIDELELTEWSDQLFGDLNVPTSFDPFQELLLDIRISYTPGQKYQMEPYRKINLGSKWPTFYLQYKKAIPCFFRSEIDFDFLELGLDQTFKPGTFGTSKWNIRTGKFLQAKNARFTDFKFFRGSDPWFFADPLRNFQLLGPTISTQNEYFSGSYHHNFNGVLMDKIPLLKRTALQTSGGAGLLLIRDNSFFHSEIYAGLQYPFRIRTERFKIGAYFVTAYSNYTNALEGQFKFGVSFFNSAKNQWSY